MSNNVHRNLGDRIEGDKIVLEAGFIRLQKDAIKLHNHTSDRATGEIMAGAYISKPFRWYKPESLK